jgi:hypothetical protein
MNRYFITTLFILSNLNTVTCQVKEIISFEVLKFKNQIKSDSDRYVTFVVKNRSDKNLLIPNVIAYNNISNKNLNLDFAFELCEIVNGKCVMNDSCYLYTQPLIPEEGYKLKAYKKNAIFYYYSYLPHGCLMENRNYKIRFTYFPKNSGYKKIQSQWYSLSVLKNFF